MDTETCNYRGTLYAGVIVWPRGFANEYRQYIVPANDRERIAFLQQKVDQSANREPGDNYDARWMTKQEISQHIYSCRTNDATGNIHLLTVDECGNPDAMMV